MTYNKKILLISGFGRSGSTIFAKLMSEHSKIQSVPEWRFLTDPGGILEFVYILKYGNIFMMDQAYRRLDILLNSLKQKKISLYLNAFKKIDKNFKIKLTEMYSGSYKIPKRYHDVIDKFLVNINQFQWNGQYVGLQFRQKKIISTPLLDFQKIMKLCKDFLNEIVILTLKDSGKRFFLEKNTWTSLHFDIISELYPSSKLINITRDPRDVVASYIKQPWMPSDAVHSAYILKKNIKMWWDSRKKVNKKRWTEISLEKLVFEKEITLKNVCKFWDIDFDENILKLELSKSSIGRWKYEFDISTKNKINKILSDEIDIYGYKK